MKYLFAKSIQLIIIAIVIGVLVTLCLSNIVEAFRMVGIPANGLSDKYYSFSIGEYRDKITKNKIVLSDMLTFLKEQGSPFILLKESDLKIFGVYASRQIFEPDIISGRTFTEDDFKNKTNTIIVSEDLKDKCIEKNGRMLYRYDTTYFDVIGIYKRSINSINQDALAYYNLSTDKLKTIDIIYDNYIFGNFQIDAGNNTKEIVRKLDDYCIVKITRSNIDNTFTERLYKTLSSQGITLFPIILIILLILLNSINIASNWIENRKKEIYVRRLVGATSKKISIMLFKDFMLIITLSYMPALLIILFISKIDLKIFLNFNYSIYTIVISYSIVLLIGLVSSVLMLRTYYKNSISQNRG